MCLVFCDQQKCDEKSAKYKKDGNPGSSVAYYLKYPFQRFILEWEVLIAWTDAMLEKHHQSCKKTYRIQVFKI